MLISLPIVHHINCRRYILEPVILLSSWHGFIMLASYFCWWHRFEAMQGMWTRFGYGVTVSSSPTSILHHIIPAGIRKKGILISGNLITLRMTPYLCILWELNKAEVVKRECRVDIDGCWGGTHDFNESTYKYLVSFWTSNEYLISGPNLGG